MIHVFHSFPEWQLSGVNTWSANLIRESGTDPEFKHSVLFTGVPRQPQPDCEMCGIPYSFLLSTPPPSRKEEWCALKRRLEARAPCIYIPQYDFHRSAAVPTFSPGVKVCAIVHSDEDCYYDLIRRIGYACDAIVTVSSYLAGRVSAKFPKLASRVQFIAPGVPAVQSGADRSNSGRLELAYCNRLAQYQKRVFDLPAVMAELRRLGIDCHLTVTGDGPDAAELRERFTQAGVEASVTMTGRIPDHELADVLARSHAFLLVSDFEGLPSSMLEAMSVGCVPVVYNIESGVRDAIQDGVNGTLVSRGDTGGMAKQLADLHSDRPRLSNLAEACKATHQAHFSLERMAASYRSLFVKIFSDTGTQALRDGKIRPPRDLKLYFRVLRKVGFARR